MRLSKAERRRLATVFAVVLPETDSAPDAPTAAELDTDAFAEHLVAQAPAQFTLGLRAALWITELAPPLLLGRWARFSGLSTAERVQLLERLESSDVYLLRELPTLFKTVACLGVCGLPHVQDRLGIAVSDRRPPIWAEKP